jgi:hypothetical protein
MWRPPGSTTASPQLGWCCLGDFLAANSTGTNRPAEAAESLDCLLLSGKIVSGIVVQRQFPTL